MGIVAHSLQDAAPIAYAAALEQVIHFFTTKVARRRHWWLSGYVDDGRRWLVLLVALFVLFVGVIAEIVDRFVASNLKQQ